MARTLGTEKPMWLTVDPFVGPVGACARRNTSTLGNLMKSAPLGDFIGTPPRPSTQNFFCASMLVTLRW